MKKIVVFILPFFLLAACSPPTPDIHAMPEDGVSRHLLPNDLTGYYGTVFPVVSSPARGLVYSFIGGTPNPNRRGNNFDIEGLEQSLMRNSQRYFDPQDLYFQEGQHLSRNLVVQLLGRQLTPYQLENSPDSLNIGQNPPAPTRNNNGNVVRGDSEILIEVGGQQFPSEYIINLAFLIEQNFVSIDGEGEQQLEGVSIGLALNPYQIMPDFVGATPIEVSRQMPEEEVIARGREIAGNILEILRATDELSSIPIMMGLYILQSRDAVIPGRMVEVGFASRNSTEIRTWEPVRENHFLLPDRQVLEYDTDLVSEYDHFITELRNGFSPHLSIVGNASFVDGQLRLLDITIHTQLYGLAENMSMHQLVGDLVGKMFSPRFNVRVTIRNNREIYGVISRQPNDEVFVHRFSW